MSRFSQLLSVATIYKALNISYRYTRILFLKKNTVVTIVQKCPFAETSADLRIYTLQDKIPKSLNLPNQW